MSVGFSLKNVWTLKMDRKQTLQCLLGLLTVFIQYGAICGNRCTEVLSRNELREVVKQVPCTQKYEARCAWLSLSYCTFYRQTFCDKKANETIKTYFIKTDCCPGYLLAKNGSCIKIVPGVDYEKLKPVATEDPYYVYQQAGTKQKVNTSEVKISGGGYAGIICGMILLMSIVGFTVMGIRKRRRKKKAKSEPPQRVLYIPSPNTPIVKNSLNQSVSRNFQREVTPSSSHMITPPGSPIKMMAAVDIPLGTRSAHSCIQAPPSTSVTPPPVTEDCEDSVAMPLINNVTKSINDESSQEVSQAVAQNTPVNDISSTETPPMVTEDTPLVTNEKALDSSETPDIELDQEVTADTPLVFDVENLHIEDLPESDI